MCYTGSSQQSDGGGVISSGLREEFVLRYCALCREEGVYPDVRIIHNVAAEAHGDVRTLHLKQCEDEDAAMMLRVAEAVWSAAAVGEVDPCRTLRLRLSNTEVGRAVIAALKTAWYRSVVMSFSIVDVMQPFAAENAAALGVWVKQCEVLHSFTFEKEGVSPQPAGVEAFLAEFASVDEVPASLRSLTLRDAALTEQGVLSVARMLGTPAVACCGELLGWCPAFGDAVLWSCAACSAPTSRDRTTRWSTVLCDSCGRGVGGVVSSPQEDGALFTFNCGVCELHHDLYLLRECGTSSLESLCLDGTVLQPVGAQVLGCCRLPENLRELSLNRCGQRVTELLQLPQSSIKRLEVAGNGLQRFQQVKFLGNCPKLRRVNLSGNNWLNDELVKVLSSIKHPEGGRVVVDLRDTVMSATAVTYLTASRGRFSMILDACLSGKWLMHGLKAGEDFTYTLANVVHQSDTHAISAMLQGLMDVEVPVTGRYDESTRSVNLTVDVSRNHKLYLALKMHDAPPRATLPNLSEYASTRYCLTGKMVNVCVPVRLRHPPLFFTSTGSRLDLHRCLRAYLPNVEGCSRKDSDQAGTVARIEASSHHLKYRTHLHTQLQALSPPFPSFPSLAP